MHLREAGYRADQRPGMSEGIQMSGLFRNEVSCVVNYSGNIWTLVMKQTGLANRADAVGKVTAWLRDNRGVVCLGSLGFENAYGFAVTESRAQQFQLRSLADLPRYADQVQAAYQRRLRVGGDHQFFDRPEWKEVRKRYRIQDASVDTRAMDPTLVYGALQSGQVDVIVGYTSDGRIPAYRLRILEDPQGVLPPYDALLLLSSEAAADQKLVQTLRRLIGQVDLADMQAANCLVDVEKQTPRRSATGLLQSIRKRQD